MTAVEAEILSILTCPLCPSYLRPPIQVCTNGHSLCPGCFERAKPVCPQCCGSFKNRRCFILEKICERLFVACKFKGLGCCFTTTRGAVRRHERRCVWRNLRRRKHKKYCLVYV